jgi:hypothetical protein
MTRDDLQRRLEEAGAVMLSMPGSAMPQGFRSNLPAPILDACEAYGWDKAAAPRWRPNGRQIARMDEALGWVSLIPAAPVSADPASRNGGATLRRLVQMRLMVRPGSWYQTPNAPKYIFSWRTVAATMGADPRSVKTWHGMALGVICAAIEKKMAA